MRERPLSANTNTKRAIGYAGLVLVGLLLGHFITNEQFASLWNGLVALFGSISR